MSSSNQFLKGLLNPVVLLMMFVLIILFYWYVDQGLVNWLSHFNWRDNVPLLTWVTYLGNLKLYLILFFVAALFFRYVHANALLEERAWFLWLCVAISNLACGILKVVFGRARPDLWLQSQEYGFSWLNMDSLHWSFPSGHTTTIMSIVFGLSVMFPRFWFWFISLGVLVALSRIFLLQHYLSDVLAAVELTLLVVAGLVYVLRKKGWLSQIWQIE